MGFEFEGKKLVLLLLFGRVSGISAKIGWSRDGFKMHRTCILGEPQLVSVRVDFDFLDELSKFPNFSGSAAVKAVIYNTLCHWCSRV